jgi:hypothetical protein
MNAPTWTGCPCGCQSGILGDDPDCWRHKPVPPPSTYSLPRPELAAHIRQLRRDGWQSWEIRARFDSRTVTDAA